jgi:hypothetical protein
VLIFFGVPATFFLSLLVSVPYTYLAWARRPVPKVRVAKLVAAASIALAIPIAYVGLGMRFSPACEFAGAACLVFGIAALILSSAAAVWWFSMPRSSR